jgi:aminoglycoside 3-N-acetyltransferase
MLRDDGEAVPLKRLIAAMRFLRAHEKVRFRPVLSQRELLAALKKAGVRRGDLLMAHTSLSDFGYFERGAETVIEGLLAAVGSSGTVCVPTHSLSWIGEQPYDPKRSPSTVGAVTNVFMKRPDAVRSLHPTHSVAAIGPLARSLVAGHDQAVAPMARDAFWGRFFDAGGKVLMMCKLGSNTLLHCGELWGGVPFPPCVCHIWRDGQRVEIVVPSMPWHTNSFVKVHESLAKRGLLRRVPLGESFMSLMPAREAVETQLEQIRGNPLLALGNKCECRWCRAVKARLPVVVGAPLSPVRERADVNEVNAG